MSRPEPCRPAAGFQWVAEPDLGWRLEQGHRCRSGAGFHTAACGKPSVAALNRGQFGRPNCPNWWAYCPEHMYGRWVENGRVLHWVLRSTSAMWSP